MDKPVYVEGTGDPSPNADSMDWLAERLKREEEPRAGRPLRYGGPLIHTTVGLNAEQYEWLMSREQGASATMRRLVNEAMERGSTH
jgi:hypothetical protein